MYELMKQILFIIIMRFDASHETCVVRTVWYVCVCTLYDVTCAPNDSIILMVCVDLVCVFFQTATRLIIYDLDDYQRRFKHVYVHDFVFAINTYRMVI